MAFMTLAILSLTASALQPSTPVRLRSGSISDADYPAAAAGASGTTRISMVIDTDGRVAHCSVSGSSGNAALDAATCPLAVRRFRFTPATRNGQPVTGNYQQSIRWVAPE